MPIIKRKHFKILFIVFLLLLTGNCQLKNPNYSHGINFLENREKTLILNKTNQNDVIKSIGRPHALSLKDDNTWLYFERTIAKGKMHKLGQNVLTTNNVLELKFNKFGILSDKKIYNKKDMKKVSYAKEETINSVQQQSFVGSFLSSIRQKMYGKRKF